MSESATLAEAYHIARGETMLLPTRAHLESLVKEIEYLKSYINETRLHNIYQQTRKE
jgi:hypothetical protein